MALPLDENQSQYGAREAILPPATDLVAQYFRAMAHPTRLRIAVLLSKQELTVTQLVAALPLPEPVVSRHLGLLRQVGIATRHRDGRRVIYRLANDTVERLWALASRLNLERHR